MKDLLKFKTYIAVLAGYFALPWAAGLIKMKLDNTVAIIIAIVIAFLIDQIIK